MSSPPSPLGPYKLVSVNKAPERAKRLIGVLVEDVKEKYTIVHVGNAAAMDMVEPLVSEQKPDLLVRLLSYINAHLQNIHIFSFLAIGRRYC
jgi:hypothetical protein